MRPLKDPDDLSAHITRTDGAIKIYCVECERWTEVIVVAVSTVTYRQNQWTNRAEDAQQPSYHCGSRGCWADVGYLLSENDRDAILTLANVPMLHTKRTPTSVPMAVLPKQMRLL